MTLTPVAIALDAPFLTIPLFEQRVRAGFPSPADDFIEGGIDLNRELVPHPAATFCVRVQGDSMVGAGIRSGDLLIVDRSVQAVPGSVVVALLNGEFTVKELSLHEGMPLLLPANPRYPAIEVAAGDDFEVWGVVAHVIRSF